MNPTGVQDVPALCGCFLAIRRALYEELGGFDVAMGNYGSEDLELCLRLWRAGLRCVTVARARVTHRFHYGERTDIDLAEHLYGSLRFGSSHLESGDLAPYVDALRGGARFPVAAARLLASDIGLRRAEIANRSVASARGAIGRLCPEAFGGGGPAARLREDQVLVFVGGLHRSGTTLVADLLASHPEATGFRGTGMPKDEGQHLQDVYPTARAFGGPGRFAFDPRAPMTETHALATEANAQRLFTSWARFWNLERRVLIEKSPPNLVRGRFLQALFPGSRLIMVRRHPVAVALSTERWRPDLDFFDLVGHWFAAWDRFEADRPHLSNVLVVSYEELCREPQPVLTALGDFASLPGLEDGGRIHAPQLDVTSQAWRDRVESEGPGWLAELVDRFGPAAARYDYDIEDPTRTLPAPARS
jgi:hypothetical protein